MSAPGVCVVGAGSFGRRHLQQWKSLEDEGKVTLEAVVVATEASARQVTCEFGVEATTELSDALLARVDIVDIVTPASTHIELLERAVPRAIALVEKPVVISEDEIERLLALEKAFPGRIIGAHNYRFLPVVEKLRELLIERAGTPRLVEIEMLNEGEPDGSAAPVNLEWIHAFDLIDFFYGGNFDACHSVSKGSYNEVSLRYEREFHAVLRLGWSPRERVRRVKVCFDDATYLCDLLRNTIKVQAGARFETFNYPNTHVALRRQFERVLAFRAGDAANPMPATATAKVLRDALKATPAKPDTKPRAVVVGAGIFGANIALELGKFCDVAIHERHDGIMSEVSFANQWRHHSGFHYPRSYDTIREIKTTKAAFEELYGEYIYRHAPSYFCPSATGVEIPAERYLAACSSNYLSFNFEYPRPGTLNRDAVSLSLRTDEGVYDFYGLKERVERDLREAPHVSLYTGSEIVSAELLPSGQKRITYRNRDGEFSETVDYLVCATYANRNLFARWFNFPVEPLRFDLYEMLVLRIPMPEICITIIDGPFTSLVSLGHDNLFLLSHIHDSVLKSDVTADGLPPDWGHVDSNRDNMIASALRYMPILEQAEVVESRFATRAVNAYARDFDARPTVIRDHGFGCWSVLGGKIITSVSNAREIAQSIRAAHTSP
jgi:predicted dehydrogenase